MPKKESICAAKQGKKNQIELLIEGYKEMAKESLTITKEWGFCR